MYTIKVLNAILTFGTTVKQDNKKWLATQVPCDCKIHQYKILFPITSRLDIFMILCAWKKCHMNKIKVDKIRILRQMHRESAEFLI